MGVLQGRIPRCNGRLLRITGGITLMSVLQDEYVEVGGGPNPDLESVILAALLVTALLTAVVVYLTQ